MNYDVIVVGGGIAGSYAALSFDPSYRVLIITKESLEESNTYLAQGGIAAVLGKTDRKSYHVHDTLTAGAGICDVQAVQTIVDEAEQNIRNLHKLGVRFDLDRGELALTREGGHSQKRILHIHGDATGRGLVNALIPAVACRENITIRQAFCIDLILEEGACRGIRILDEHNQDCAVRAPALILATGGIGVVYGTTTNARSATGDGLAMAFRAGADITHMEFVQFHPTGFHTTEQRRFLISEAVRGEGALLRNAAGERFMPQYDERAELAPRDVVSRAIFQEMEKTGADHVYLDATVIETEHLLKRFPNIRKRCLEGGLDMVRDWIPVSPCQHYSIGGIRTDTFGQTNIPGLYACGEVSCTGVHGANRLASNSLLEAVVIGKRTADRIQSTLTPAERAEPVVCRDIRIQDVDVSDERRAVQNTMLKYAGIMRTEEGLKQAVANLDDVEEKLRQKAGFSKKVLEAQNILTVGKLIIAHALNRKESIGTHFLLKRRD